MIIKGANLGEVSAELKNLSDYSWTDDERLKQIIKKIENLYLNSQSQSKNYPINPLSIDSDGNVILKEHAEYHRCSNSLESLKTISEHGILASEWFGTLESEREGCFCAFITRMKGANFPFKGALGEDDRSALNIGKNVNLFFDDDNYLFKCLLHLDYFEFAHQKRVNPNYRELYSKDELEILEELIEPLSPSGKDMRKDYDFKTNYWSAIPGGIPSAFINGICIKNNNYTKEELDEISALFPHAVIFDANKKVLRYPFIKSSEKTTLTDYKI